ncbi:MAG: hypothetical protein JO088_02075, partial [Acidobacteria bacterium]|nr:hypothetical protein [Acidobacteriota bacterium]
MNTENGVATFFAENRYAAMYPHILAVPQPTLHVMKRLRAAGIRVRVEPSDQRPLCFTFQRGIGDWLADPAIVLLASIPVNIVSNIVFSWWQERKRRDREFPSATVAFVVEEDGDTRYYSLDGEPMSRQETHEISQRAQRSAKVFYRSINTPAPDPRRRYPIQRDHSGTIVGWAAGLRHSEKSLDLVDVFVSDPIAEADIASGKLAGVSVGAIAQRSTCSICLSNYV